MAYFAKRHISFDRSYNFQTAMSRDSNIVAKKIALSRISNVQAQYHPDENELFYHTIEAAHIPGDEYISSALRDDLTDILRDIRESGKDKSENKNAISSLSAIEEFQKKVQSVIAARGSGEEQAAKVYLAAWGIDYDCLTPEEFVVLMGILDKSGYKGNSINRRGRRQSVKKRKK